MAPKISKRSLFLFETCDSFNSVLYTVKDIQMRHQLVFITIDQLVRCFLIILESLHDELESFGSSRIEQNCVIYYAQMIHLGASHFLEETMIFWMIIQPI